MWTEPEGAHVRKRVILGILLVLMIGSLLMPFYTLYPHKDLPADVAAAFPSSVSGIRLIFEGSSVLPVEHMPELSSVAFREGLLAAAALLSLAGGLLAMLKRKIAAHAAVFFGAAGALIMLLFVFYTQQLDKSILFSIMLTAKWYIWFGFALFCGLLTMEVLQLKGMEPLALKDAGWRKVSAGFSLLALVMLFLPFINTYVSAGIFASPREDALVSRSVSGIDWLVAKEPMLQQLAAQSGDFAEPLSGGAISSLAMLSASGKDIRNLFMIPTNNSSIRLTAIIACALLLIGMVMQLIQKVDKWVPACILFAASLIFAAEVFGSLMVDDRSQFAGAAYQLMHLGLGGYTPVPLLIAGAAAASAISAAFAIHRANEPYFVNPIPQKKRMLAVSILLAGVSVVLLLLPIYQVSLYTPGKINTGNPAVAQTVSGLSLITLSKPAQLLYPANNRGRALYTQEAASNGFTITDIQSMVSNNLSKMSAATMVSLLFVLGALYLMFRQGRQKKTIVAVLLTGAVIQVASTLMPIGMIPNSVGRISSSGPLYASIGTTVFSAFFAAFMDKEELPKKYKLFLLMLPFLVAVFLFSYLPLYGWSYALYNFKFGVPMDQQEFVGLKWFTELVTNVGHRNNIARVMSNTFALSGLNIATSWLPMVLAILLNEVSRTRFKKFVQIFTTLPNFISWTLVFSFALAMFAMDTGIYSKFMLGTGFISEPVAWLNSGENIWIKMWAWSTWKGLGWGAIMYLAAIAGIDQELYEAARVDGAGRWKQIRHITIPGLLPTFFVLLLLSISNIVNNGMEQYLVFQNSMNKSTIEVLDLYVYNITIASTSSNMYSFGTAIGILKTLFSVMLLFTANFASKMLRGESII